MPEKPASERTEPPTPERLRKARQEGKVPQSQELPTALTLGMLLVAMALAAPRLWDWFVAQVQLGLSGARVSIDPETAVRLFRERGTEAGLLIAPMVAATTVAAFFGSVLVSGWSVSPKAMKLDPSRLNPVSGLKQLISVKSLMRVAVSLAKLAAIVAIVATYLHGKLDLILSLVHATPIAALGATVDLIFGVVARVTAVFLGVALLDAVYQKWQYKRDLRMTKQEVKEERRQHEVAPEVRGRMRAIQIEMVRKRMLQNVPTADVVVTNPTHVAVALKYDPGAMQAPTVVAKGGDLLCEKIKEIARTHDVPIVHRPELARTLYGTVEVGEPIPELLYVAVAEVLAMIYRLRRERRGIPTPERPTDP